MFLASKISRRKMYRDLSFVALVKASFPFKDSRDELSEQAAALSDDTGSAGFFLLRSGKVQPVVHLTFLVEYRLLLFDFSDTFLFRLV